MTDKKPRKPARLPSERTIDMPSRSYNPSKEDRAQAFDMPKAKMATLRRAFFRPIKSENDEG